MSAFAPVAPIQILEALKDNHLLGNYHLLLAHHVLEHPERFKACFEDLQYGVIIMDNSIVELGDSEGEIKVLEAVKAVEGHWSTPVIPVLTDVMGDGQNTRIKGDASYDWWTTNASCPLMVVLQGGFSEEVMAGADITPSDVWQDFCKTADHFLLDPKYHAIKYVGIPRFLVGLIGTRQLAIQYVKAIRPDIQIHLLGFSDDVTDDIICANMPGVMGIDSAVPLRYSYDNGEEVNTDPYTPTKAIPPRPKDWFEKGKLDTYTVDNLENMRNWVRG